MNEIAGVYCGPPFSAANRCPSISKVATMTLPFGPGPASPKRLTLPIFECQVNVASRTNARRACRHKNGRIGLSVRPAYIRLCVVAATTAA
jgi:hypothetical protein